MRVRWSDECSVEHGRGIIPTWTFTRPCDQVCTGDVRTYNAHKGVKKMLWACFCYSGRTGLIPLDGDPESRRGGVTSWAIRALYDAFLPEFVGQEGILIHNNARVHTAKIIRIIFQDRNIKVMKWPPYFPDLNPIENLWAVMKKEIYKIHPKLEHAPDTDETLHALIEAAKQAWHAISQ